MYMQRRLTMWSEPALSSMLPSHRKVRASVAPVWAWKHPTQVELGTDHTLTSPDMEPEQSMEEEEKERLRTEDWWPDSDWGNREEREGNCVFKKNSNNGDHLPATW